MLLGCGPGWACAQGTQGHPPLRQLLPVCFPLFLMRTLFRRVGMCDVWVPGVALALRWHGEGPHPPKHGSPSESHQRWHVFMFSRGVYCLPGSIKMFINNEIERYAGAKTFEIDACMSSKSC